MEHDECGKAEGVVLPVTNAFATMFSRMQYIASNDPIRRHWSVNVIEERRIQSLWSICGVSLNGQIHN